MAATQLFAQENYKTTWLGNTLGYGDKKSWVQNHVNTMYVAPDGACFTQAIWDEGHHETSVYKDGKKLGYLNAGRGLSVGGNGDTVFVHSGHEVVGRDIKTFAPIDFSIAIPAGLNGPAKIYSIVARDGYLAISDPNNDRILVYLAQNRKLIYEFTVKRPADMAIDTNNNLWIVQSPVSYRDPILNDAVPEAEPKISCYSIDGEKRPVEITGIEYPTAIAIDYKGRLLVCDDGKNQQVYCYKSLSTSPRLDSSFFNKGRFGDLYGIFQPKTSEKGVAKPHRFYHLAGVGTDAEGNLYVSLGGPAPKGDNPLMDTDIRAFDKKTGRLKWQLLGKEFVDMGDLDPDDKTKWYTKDSKYSLNWNKQEAGTEWSYEARTIDPFTYPHDARAKITGNPGTRTSIENIFMRRVGDDRHLFMYGCGMAGEQYPIRVFRFNKSTDGEFAIPVLYLSKQYGELELDKWPFNRPSNIKEGDEYMWLDKNGNGQMDAGEYEISTYDDYPYHVGSYIDSEGGIWTCHRERGIRRLTCKEVDENGIPEYSFGNREFYPCPLEFQDVHFVRYLGGEEDIMYVAGWTQKNPNETGGDKPSQVHTIVKYKNWKTSPTVIWESHPSDYKILDKGASFEVEGDFVFVGYEGADGEQPIVNGTVWVFSAETGTYLCELTPGPEVGNACGWLDIWDSSIRAYKINEEYVIFVEDDWHSKTIIYRWNPRMSYKPK